jgi:hypothetical protein
MPWAFDKRLPILRYCQASLLVRLTNIDVWWKFVTSGVLI